ncbi:MAG: murein L,D-transpeptidase catalytic domain family protein [Cytophagaceae bacterium]|nr:murein L,D-transpeptidase catalytic domain family protein [Cytophagaceae bacterium]
MRTLLVSKISLSLFFLLLFTAPCFSKHDVGIQVCQSEAYTLYNELQLEQLGLNQSVFAKALKGWSELKRQNLLRSNVLSIVDLSQSSNSKRLYVIDMEKKELLFNTYVAHGRNSGQEFALDFSNELNSYKSSLGFYLTDETYQGIHGLSMRLKGMEKGINDIAEQRGIVMHGAPYVSESFIQQNGRLGRSQGCPAVMEELCEPIINSIKGGSCFFMFYPEATYIENSKLL